MLLVRVTDDMWCFSFPYLIVQPFQPSSLSRFWSAWNFMLVVFFFSSKNSLLFNVCVLPWLHSGRCVITRPCLNNILYYLLFLFCSQAACCLTPWTPCCQPALVGVLHSGVQAVSSWWQAWYAAGPSRPSPLQTWNAWRRMKEMTSISSLRRSSSSSIWRYSSRWSRTSTGTSSSSPMNRSV